MQKIIKIGIAFVFTILLVNSAFAEEFDPIADLYDNPNDALLNLNLPEENYTTMPIVEEKTASTNEILSVDPLPMNAIENNSGGAIEINTTPKPIPTNSTVLPIANLPIEVESYSYSGGASANLAPTGPTEAALIALFLTFPTAWFVQRKFFNA